VYRRGGTPNALRHADLNRSEASENQREQEPNTTSHQHALNQDMGQHILHQPYNFWLKVPTNPFGFTKPTTSQEPKPPLSLIKNRQKSLKKQRNRSTTSDEGTNKTAMVEQQKHNPSIQIWSRNRQQNPKRTPILRRSDNPLTPPAIHQDETKTHRSPE